MTKAELRAECTMLDDEACEARAAATELHDALVGTRAALAATVAFYDDLDKDVADLARENARLRKAIRLLSKSL